MRTIMIGTVLWLCLCSSISFANVASINAGNTAVTTTILDTNSSDSGPLGAIINAINRLDAWIQKNLW